MNAQIQPDSVSQVAADAEFQLVVAQGYCEWIEALAMSIEASLTNEGGVKSDVLTLANLIRHLSKESAESANEASRRFKAVAEQPIVKRG